MAGTPIDPAWLAREPIVSVDWGEFKKGLSATGTYLLSHHEPSEWYRCYAISVGGRTIRLCARCSGIYPGIAIGLFASLGGTVGAVPIGLIAVLPAPALIDWAVTTFSDRGGYNLVRTVTGALLGVGYGLGLATLLSGRILPVVAIGLLYGLLAGIGLTLAGDGPERGEF